MEEYRYDALGRRIWRRLVRPDTFCPLMNRASGCLSVVERTVWDGDQVLAEVRADGGQAASAAALECDGNCFLARPNLEGKALYVHGGALDHPLVVFRDSYADVIVPVYSWRGRVVDGICVNGSIFCTDFTWPARTESARFEDAPVTDPRYSGPVAWGGNQLDTQKDGSGLVYKRNRYYDPASGRFTQVDPIGLGGGLSAYGFGGGDQVSYADPFGLRVDMTKLDADQREKIQKLRKNSKTFDKWFNAVDKVPADRLTLHLTTVHGTDWNTALKADGGARTTIPPKEVTEHASMIFSASDQWPTTMEFESVAAHEFAHAAAGLDNGTPAECYSNADGARSAAEDCAAHEQNAVHKEIGFRDRNSYSDTGPYGATTPISPPN